METLDRELIELQELFEHGLVAPQDFAIKSRSIEERKRQLAGQRVNLPPDWSLVEENGQKYYLHTSFAKSLVPPSVYAPPQVSELASLVGEAAMNTAVLKNRIHMAQKVVERAGFNNKMKPGTKYLTMPGVESELSLRQAETDLNALLELLDLRESGRRNMRLEQTQHLSMSQIWNQSEEIRSLMDNIVQVASEPAQQPPPPSTPLPPVSRDPPSPSVPPTRSVSTPNVSQPPNIRHERGFTSPSPAVGPQPATLVPSRSLSSLPAPAPSVPGTVPQPPFRVLCQHKYQARNERELSFGKGEHLAIIKVSGDWWYAKNAQKGYGWIPMHFVTIE